AAVLPLLLDVWVPADRRPDLGLRRRQGPRLPARLHGGPHDAQRRRPPARGRALAPAGLDGPQLSRLRPGVRLRDGDDRAGRAAADGGGWGGRLLLPEPVQRELRAAGPAPRRRRRDPRRDVPPPPGAGG